MGIKEVYLGLKVVPHLTIQGLSSNVIIFNGCLKTLNIVNSANKGGVFKISMSKIYLVNSEFIQNYAVEGGVIYQDNIGFSYLSNVKAQKNYALVSGGIIQGLTNSYFELIDS